MMLGAYVGTPSQDAPTNAAFAAAVAAFHTAMGCAPQCMNAYIDYTGDFETWVVSAATIARAWAATPATSGIVPIIGLPMARASDWSVQPPVAVFDEIASGKYDTVWVGIIAAWVGAGYTTLYLRPGYEMDGRYVPWFMGHNPSDLARFNAAFRQIASVARGCAQAHVQIVWNPSAISWTDADVTLTYPGDEYVDIIGLDIDSTIAPLDLWDPDAGRLAANVPTWATSLPNKARYWAEPTVTQFDPDGRPSAGWGMTKHLAFAKSRAKPIAICECGTMSDDPDFPGWLAGALKAAAVEIAFVMVWDAPLNGASAVFTDGSKPQVEAAWQAAFGSGSSWTYTSPEPLVPPLEPPLGPPVQPQPVLAQAIVFDASVAGGLLSITGTKATGGIASCAVMVDGRGVWTTKPLPDGAFAIHLGPIGPGVHLIEVFSVASSLIKIVV